MDVRRRYGLILGFLGCLAIALVLSIPVRSQSQTVADAPHIPSPEASLFLPLVGHQDAGATPTATATPSSQACLSNLPTGLRALTFTATSDGSTQAYNAYIPPTYHPANYGGAGYPVLIWLHFLGGDHNSEPFNQYVLDNYPGTLLTQCRDRGYLCLAPYAHGDSLYYGPGEQDVYDMLADFQGQGYCVNNERLYLSGFSMGGSGTYALGFQNPDYWAAILPQAGVVDWADHIAYVQALAANSSDTCQEIGGLIRDAYAVAIPLTDTAAYAQHSAALQPYNALNLPVRVFHDTQDRFVPYSNTANPITSGPYGQVTDASEADGMLDLMAVITPTLPGYDIAFWAGSSPAEDCASGGGNHNNLFDMTGAFDFFDAHPARVRNPARVIFASADVDEPDGPATPRHRRAYWLTLDDLAVRGQFGQVDARVEASSNTLHLTIAGVTRQTIDLNRTGLNLEGDLTVQTAASPGLTNTLVFDDRRATEITAILRDGSPLPGSEYTVTGNRITILNQSLTAAHTFVLQH